VRHIDVRLIAATTGICARKVAWPGISRRPFSRLSSLQIRFIRFTERRKDIPLWWQFFLKKDLTTRLREKYLRSDVGARKNGCAAAACWPGGKRGELGERHIRAASPATGDFIDLGRLQRATASTAKRIPWKGTNGGNTLSLEWKRSQVHEPAGAEKMCQGNRLRRRTRNFCEWQDQLIATKTRRTWTQKRQIRGKALAAEISLSA